jgi:hypothetical protein
MFEINQNKNTTIGFVQDLPEIRFCEGKFMISNKNHLMAAFKFQFKKMEANNQVNLK